MTDVSLETLNRRTAVAAVHAEAARAGLDGETLLDSKSFYDQVTSLDPDAPAFRAQVRELVAGAAGIAQQPSPTRAQNASGEPRQWTLEDVKKSTPAETVAAINAGLLRDLGHAPARRKRP
jgi:hypothetical protein